MIKLPPKIDNLYILEKDNFNVPLFYIITEESILDIQNEYLKITDFFKKNNIKNIIIRSASSIEDGEEKSLAGFFESSDKLLVDDLTIEDIKEVWRVNKKKINKNNRLYVFLQGFIDFDYSGVLFTQDFCNDTEAILELSKSKFNITSGKKADNTLVYNKESKKWVGEFNFSKNIKQEIVRLINYIDKQFITGADLELGVKNNKLFVFQLRPITRNQDEKILIKERKRLSLIFKKNFKQQLWVKNDFTNAIKDISLTSLNFYNHLFNSKFFLDLLNRSKFTNVKKINNLRILENIGNRTFFNVSEAENIFIPNKSFFSKFKELLMIKANEPILRKDNEENKNNSLKTEEIFAWLYLSGNYFQFYLNQDKNFFKKDFDERLKNTELLSSAREVFLEDKKQINDFINDYFYLSENPYELESKRIIDMTEKEVVNIFFNNKKIKNTKDNKNVLSKETVYWLSQKIYWKNEFLKELYNRRKDLIKEFKIGNKKSDYKLSSIYLTITGDNYPLSGNSEKEDVVVVAGNINQEKIILVNEEDKFNFEGEYIAVESFPNKWIRYIPKLKGIITSQGNKLSHMAITCREYNIPYIISPNKFKRLI